MTDADRLARLRLIRTDGIGPITYRQLLRRFGTAERALEALPNLMRDARPFARDAAEREVEAVARLGGFHLFPEETAFSPLLSAMEDAPPVLVARGDPALAAQPCIGVVGARNASAAARQWAREAAGELAAAGVVVVSGLARGIDAAAHEGALPLTVACIAGGIDIAYPPENAALQERIANEGLLLAEMPPGMQPLARHFPRRNRLIAGLSEALLVVEAAVGSGSLITARIAADLGRDVLAVPGSPLDPRARGCNALIRDGATLVESAADVLAARRPFDLAQPVAAWGGARIERRAPAARAAAPAQPRLAMDEAQATARVRALLGPAPVAVEELIRQTGLDAAAVGAALTDLEMDGALARHAGGRVALA